MHWTRLALITLAAGMFTSLTDWLMAGDWLHRRYSYPEAWRQGVDSKAIALTSPLPFLTCGILAYLLARLGMLSVGRATGVAMALWVIGPLPLILTMAAFFKLHRVFAGFYAASWLVKLVAAALAAACWMR